MLNKRKVFTLCKSIPAFIPKQLAIDILHDHKEVITLNPLVIGHTSIRPPRHASPDEYACTWYEIEERIQYIPGVGQMGSGKISFTGCFQNMPWGLQTHVYAPMGVDLRVQYRIAGDPLGSETRTPRELGMAELGAPEEGLYLRTDIEFSSNVALASFVRTQLKAAIQEMVDRMVKRAEKLDAEVLQGMIDDEKLNPTMVEDADLKPNTLHQTQSAPQATRTTPSRLYDPPVIHQTVSRTDEPPTAVELPTPASEPTPNAYSDLKSNDTYFGSKPTTYYDSKPARSPAPERNSYSNPQSNQYPSPPSTDYMASQPNNYTASQPTRYPSSRPTSYRNPPSNEYQSSQQANYPPSQPVNYNASQQTNFPSYQESNYSPSQPPPYTPPQTNKFVTSQHQSHMNSQPGQVPYFPPPPVAAYYPSPPPEQGPNHNNSNPNSNGNRDSYTSYNPNPSASYNPNRYSATDYKEYEAYAPSSERPFPNDAKWSGGQYAGPQSQGQNVRKQWS